VHPAWRSGIGASIDAPYDSPRLAAACAAAFDVAAYDRTNGVLTQGLGRKVRVTIEQLSCVLVKVCRRAGAGRAQGGCIVRLQACGCASRAHPPPPSPTTPHPTPPPTPAARPAPAQVEKLVRSTHARAAAIVEASVTASDDEDKDSKKKAPASTGRRVGGDDWSAMRARVDELRADLVLPTGQPAPLAHLQLVDGRFPLLAAPAGAPPQLPAPVVGDGQKGAVGGAAPDVDMAAALQLAAGVLAGAGGAQAASEAEAPGPAAAAAAAQTLARPPSPLAPARQPRGARSKRGAAAAAGAAGQRAPKAARKGRG
jgi:hypothetical protein